MKKILHFISILKPNFIYFDANGNIEVPEYSEGGKNWSKEGVQEQRDTYYKEMANEVKNDTQKKLSDVYNDVESNVNFDEVEISSGDTLGKYLLDNIANAFTNSTKRGQRNLMLNALGNLQKQGLQVDRIPKGWEMKVENNKLYITRIINEGSPGGTRLDIYKDADTDTLVNGLTVFEFGNGGTTDDERPDSSTDDERPDSSTDDERPDSSTDDERPDSSTDDERPDSSTDDERPDSSTDDERPDSSTDDERPDSSTDDERPDSSTK